MPPPCLGLRAACRSRTAEVGLAGKRPHPGPEGPARRGTGFARKGSMADGSLRGATQGGATMKNSNGTGGRPRKERLPADVAATYDEFKEFEGRRYTGMKIGRGHKWYYD